MPESVGGVALSVLQQFESYLLHYLSHVQLIWLLVGGYSTLASLFGFFITAIDKDRAMYGGWRTSEKFLLKLSFAGGCWGVAGAMFLVHHKTEKDLFVAIELGAIALWFVIFREMAILFGPPIPG